MAAIVVGLLSAGVVLELTCERSRRWFIEHPFATATGVGVAVVFLTVLGVERFVAWSESKGWRAPALFAIEAYVFSADAVAQKIWAKLSDLVKTLPNPPTSDAVRMSAYFDLLVDQDPERLEDLSVYVRREADATSALAIQVGTTVARHQPFRRVAEDVFDIHQALGDAARRCHDLYMTVRAYGPGDRAQPRIVEHRDAAVDRLYSAVDRMHGYYLDLLEARE